MVNYKCQRCGYNTNRKSAFKSHLLRKNLCNPKLKELTQYSLLKQNGFDKEAKKINMSYQCHTNVNPSVNQQGLHLCEYCNKKFKSRQGKSKHKKLYCIKKKEELQIEILKNLLKEKDKLIFKILDENKKENAKKDKKIDKLMKQLMKLTENSGSNNNNIINSNNKITINAYGCENLEYITNNLLKKLVNKPGTAIPKLLKIIHFNDDYPENKNLKVTNIHDPYIKVHDGSNWKLKNKGDIIEDIIINKRNILDGAVVDENEDLIYKNKLDKLDDSIQDKKNNFIEKSVKDILFNDEGECPSS